MIERYLTEFFRFSRPTKAQLSNPQWQRLLHHITVEVLTLEREGRNVMDVCGARAERDLDSRLATADVILSVDVDGVIWETNSANTEAAILSAIPEPSPDNPLPSQESLKIELERIIAQDATLHDVDESSTSKTWMSISIRDPQTKLAV